MTDSPDIVGSFSSFVTLKTKETFPIAEVKEAGPGCTRPHLGVRAAEARTDGAESAAHRFLGAHLANPTRTPTSSQLMLGEGLEGSGSKWGQAKLNEFGATGFQPFAWRYRQDASPPCPAATFASLACSMFGTFDSK